MTDWNQSVIEEFRANGGKVGGMFEGAPLCSSIMSAPEPGTQGHPAHVPGRWQ